MALVKT